ncbi:HD domain-containing protein [uncultured Methanomethylovorans sp.]|uniref:HD domain-containing protein n=1 Tax=uncultured Methanomethylovorans sp. TaxID=183759 RepID=UPI002AA947D1|nr:HD domain-containing protein [uncultured Methanomethylovorans sp.]
MKKEDFLNLRTWFQNYVRSFYSEDVFISQNVRLKEDHSIRVCENISQIAISEEMDEENYYLALSIALLHDIGRFEQISKYRTFNDRRSENHALLGLTILESERILTFASQEEQHIILTAIRNHNLRTIFDDLDSKTLLHARLIRDADKLDIYKILDDYYVTKTISPNPAIDHGLPDIPDYSQHLIHDIFNNKIASTDGLSSCNDMNLARLAWLFDLNFTETFRLVKERGYIEKIINALPQNREIDAVHDHLNKYMDSMLNNA